MLKKKRVFISLLIIMLCISLLGCNEEVVSEDTATPETMDEVEATPIEAKPTPTPQPTTNPFADMITNGDFSSGYSDWYIFTQGGTGEFVESDGTAIVPVKRTGSVEWGVQPYHDGVQLSNGCTYKFTMDIKSSIERTIKIRIQKNGSPYTGYLEEIITIGPELETFEFVFEMTEPTDPACRLVINLGQFDGVILEAHEVEFDNVSLKLNDGIPDSFEINDGNVPNIRINQLGYKTTDKKIAVFADIDNGADTYAVVDEDGEIAYTGNISPGIKDYNSGEVVGLGDFTELTTEGTYYIQVEGYETSYKFDISNDVYNDVFDASLKMFYYQRCGSEITQEYAGEFAHGECHTQDATVYGTNTKLDVTGGWHDAGDYGRYITPAAKAVIDLLLSYEAFPESFTDSIGIPESGNGIPDALDEVKYELDFMFKMQDSVSGGVYHKVTPEAFAEIVMPDETFDPSIICPISAVATGDFAAVMAKASTIYSDFDQEYADKCLEAAQYAWQWLENNPDEHGFENPEEIQTGEYKDYTSKDERMWAAAELYSATGDQVYHDFVKSSEIRTGMGWKKVGMYGMFAYLSLPEDMRDTELYEVIKSTLLEETELLYLNTKEDMYGLTLTKDDYVWGSNMNVANNAMLLLIAHEYSGNDEYIDIAFEHLNYLLGKNALARSYITGYGENAAAHPHHRMTESVGKAFDGLVIGGPNKNLQDPYAQTLLAGRAPAKCYADSEQSFSTNEITIYWNSPVVYLIGYFK